MTWMVSTQTDPVSGVVVRREYWARGRRMSWALFVLDSLLDVQSCKRRLACAFRIA